jgi:hypothetical protein
VGRFFSLGIEMNVEHGSSPVAKLGAVNVVQLEHHCWRPFPLLLIGRVKVHSCAQSVERLIVATPDEQPVIFMIRLRLANHPAVVKFLDQILVRQLLLRLFRLLLHSLHFPLHKRFITLPQ